MEAVPAYCSSRGWVEMDQLETCHSMEGTKWTLYIKYIKTDVVKY